MSVANRPRTLSDDDVKAWLRAVCAPLPRAAESQYAVARGSVIFYVGRGTQSFASFARDRERGAYIEFRSDDHAVLNDVRFHKASTMRSNNQLRAFVDDKPDWARLEELVVASHAAAQRYFNPGARVSPELKNVNKQLLVALEATPASERPLPPFHGGGPTPSLAMVEQLALLHTSCVEAHDLLASPEERALAATIDADIRAYLRAAMNDDRVAARSWVRDPSQQGDATHLDRHREAGKKDSGILRGLRAAASASSSHRRGKGDIASRTAQLGLARVAAAYGASWPGRARAWLHDIDVHVAEAEANALLVEKRAPPLPPLARVLWRGGDAKDRLTSLLVRLSPPHHLSPTGPLSDHLGLLLKVGRKSTWHTGASLDALFAQRVAADERDVIRGPIEAALATNDAWVSWLKDVALAPIDDPTRRFAEEAAEFLGRGAAVPDDGRDGALISSLGRIKGVELISDGQGDAQIAQIAQMVAFRPPGRATVYAPRIARTSWAPLDVAGAVAVRDDSGECAAIHLRRAGITLSVRVGLGVGVGGGAPVRVGLAGRTGFLDEAPKGRALAHPRSGGHVAFAVAAALLSYDGPSVACTNPTLRADEDPHAVLLSMFARAADLGVAPVTNHPQHAHLRLVAGSAAELGA